MADTPTANPTPETPVNTEAPANVPTPELDKLIEKAAQSAADRVRTEYSQKLKSAQDEIENLRKEKMSASERAKYEQDQLKQELEEKARKLNRQAQELLATRELEAAGLDLAFLDYVIGSDDDATKGKISTLKQKFDAALGKAVENQMKAHGRDPMKGRDGSPQTSEVSTMTPAEIKAKAAKDPAWWDKNYAAIMERMKEGGFKK